MTQRYYADIDTGAYLGSFDDLGDVSNTPPYTNYRITEKIPPHRDAIYDETSDTWTYDDTADRWEEVRQKQRSLIVAHEDMMQIYEREVAHTDTTSTTITEATYQAYLGYFQTIRINDEASHATPEDALAALDALIPPAIT